MLFVGARQERLCLKPVPQVPVTPASALWGPVSPQCRQLPGSRCRCPRACRPGNTGSPSSSSPSTTEVLCGGPEPRAKPAARSDAAAPASVLPPRTRPRSSLDTWHWPLSPLVVRAAEGPCGPGRRLPLSTVCSASSIGGSGCPVDVLMSSGVLRCCRLSCRGWTSPLVLTWQREQGGALGPLYRAPIPSWGLPGRQPRVQTLPHMNLGDWIQAEGFRLPSPCCAPSRLHASEGEDVRNRPSCPAAGTRPGPQLSCSLRVLGPCRCTP